VAAQALIAAGRTLPAPRTVHSLHAYFLRPGDPSVPILYDVDPIRDGRSFATRRVVALQRGEAIFHLAASFAEDAEGISHQIPVAEAPDPDDLPNAVESLRDGLPPTRAWSRELNERFPLDVRFVGEPVRLAVERGVRPAPRQAIYVRSASPLGNDPLVHVCAMTYASDFFLLSTALPPHGLLMGDPALRTASLDHAVWFHHPVRADDWLLYQMNSSWAGQQRALCQGHFFDREGRLVATVVQEGLIRYRAAKA
jgi:acyl-CoA thioesterase-2